MFFFSVTVLDLLFFLSYDPLLIVIDRVVNPGRNYVGQGFIKRCYWTTGFINIIPIDVFNITIYGYHPN